ncbi:MAG: twin-arginine translocation signal domain-containing protein, partial [Acidobacteria bacterium]|nr:twin-arginine translocation signal domain-containing protein [Acidobacteriota bacterium]
MNQKQEVERRDFLRGAAAAVV